MQRQQQAVLAVLFAATASGCYKYVPAPAPEPGRLIRATVNQQGADALTSRLGPGVLELDGLLLASQPEELSVLVESYQTRLQGTLSAGNEPLRVPLGHLTTVLERRIDPVRSAILGAALVGGAFAMVKIFGPGGIVFADEEDEPPGPVEIVAPRLRLGWFVLEPARKSP